VSGAQEQAALPGLAHRPRVRSARIELDERPRCASLGDYLGADVPCDLHAGHKGSHTWAKPLTGAEEFEWTNRRRAVRRVA
jgi:hypothetical protein